MSSRDRVIQIIFGAVEELNGQRPKEQQLEKSTDTVLFGSSGKLDSLGLFTLIMATEENICNEFGVTITLADDRAMSQEESPFRTIRTLADYISLLLNEHNIT